MATNCRLQLEVSRPIWTTGLSVKAAKRQPQKKCSLNYKQATKRAQKTTQNNTNSHAHTHARTRDRYNGTKRPAKYTPYTITHEETLTTQRHPSLALSRSSSGHNHRAGRQAGSQPMRFVRRLRYTGFLRRPLTPPPTLNPRPLVVVRQAHSYVAAAAAAARQQQFFSSFYLSPNIFTARHQIPASRVATLCRDGPGRAVLGRTATIDRLLLPSFHSLWLNVFALATVGYAPHSTALSLSRPVRAPPRCAPLQPRQQPPHVLGYCILSFVSFDAPIPVSSDQ